MIPIGSIVIISDPGRCYCHYESAAERMGAIKWLYGREIDNWQGQTGIVLNSMPHEDYHNIILLLVRMPNNAEFVIDQKGVVPYLKTAKLVTLKELLDE